jgi:hypothetical protein
MLKSIKREKFSSVAITNAHTLHNKNLYSSQLLLYLREDQMKDNNFNVLHLLTLKRGGMSQLLHLIKLYC